MRSLFGSVVAAALAAAALAAQTPATAALPFKVGTFRVGDRTFLGLVLGDALVAELAPANAALERQSPSLPRVAMPQEMKDLIARYGSDSFKDRLSALARAVSSASPRPAYVRDVRAVRTRPPVMYPTTMLNAAVNYTEHANEMSGRGGAQSAASTPPPKPPETMPGLWERKAADTRWNPYLFLKPSAAVIGDGDAIRLPQGRERIDWECELAVVIGKMASHVPAERAAVVIFGYTLEIDVSDRAGRGDTRFGPDWLIGKGHDTFAPTGPFIVPKEFVADPQKLPLKYTLNGTVMQNSSTERMTHSVYEMVSFASHILTLRPGDVISMGSPAGVGTARATPIYFKPGDVGVCTYEGIGTLANPIAGPQTASSAARQRRSSRSRYRRRSRLSAGGRGDARQMRKRGRHRTVPRGAGHRGSREQCAAPAVAAERARARQRERGWGPASRRRAECRVHAIHE
jgi:2-keto-4-pentenoate hydratase/2-oxohepta-3-ene-1,7-dioic acid hydratase in catechol pathway